MAGNFHLNFTLILSLSAPYLPNLRHISLSLVFKVHGRSLMGSLHNLCRFGNSAKNFSHLKVNPIYKVWSELNLRPARKPAGTCQNRLKINIPIVQIPYSLLKQAELDLNVINYESGLQKSKDLIGDRRYTGPGA